MKKDLRVVIDTNVLISGLFGIRNSPSSQILQAIRRQKIIMVSSGNKRELTPISNSFSILT